jgi:hypothetical protein
MRHSYAVSQHDIHIESATGTLKFWSVIPAESGCRSAGRQCRFLEKEREEVSRMGS